MNTIFLEIGTFCVALILAVYCQIYSERKQHRDSLLFSRLLLAVVAIFVIDTAGWVMDGNPLFGQVWITTLVDGLDLILTTLVCWCWVQYALCIADEEKSISRKWYSDLSSWLLILQIVLVSSSQIFGFYFSVDSSGVYHREAGYVVHSMISLVMLAYSSFVCLRSYNKESDAHKKHELLFVTFIIAIPILGNIFQFYVYGYPTVWLCMAFMIFTVYIHIQHKRIHNERESQNQKLEKALNEAQVANVAKTDFLSRMSHDMRTPMNAILGIANLLSDRTDPEEIRSDVEQIKKSGEYLLSLINDTLDMSKIEAGKLELHPVPVNSEDLFKNIFTTAQVLAMQKGVKLIMELPLIEHGQWIAVMADPSRVEQIFMNLITNAVKFTPKGGSVTIHMDTFEITKEKVIDRYVITDTGIGMSKEFLAHLFEPFAQEGRANTDHDSGTGLGLAIVKQIVSKMDGSIEIKSELNSGTQITVFLSYPRYYGDIKSEEAKGADISVLKGKRVLLCEDHPVNAQIAIRLLEKQGIICERAENGAVGVEMFRNSVESYYDAILMDIRMPVMNGLEATKAIRDSLGRQDSKAIPVIAMTANAFDEDIRRCKEAGMNAHISKPVNPDELYEKIALYISDK